MGATFWATFVRNWATFWSNIWTHWLLIILRKSRIHVGQSFAQTSRAKINSFQILQRFNKNKNKNRHE